jgi:hypothetical protein
MSLHTTFRPAALATAALFGATVLTGPGREARADEVSPTGKGIAGGALLGAEVITITEALAGARPGWAYALGAIVGAGGGGVGGYFIEKGSSDGKVPTYMLAGGLALIIPAIVLTLNATRFLPEEGATEDRAPTGPAAEPGVPGAGVVGPSTPSTVAPEPTPAPAPAAPPPAPTSPPPQSLLDVHHGALRVGVPVPDVRPVYSMAEQRQFGLRTAETELRMPVLHVVF